MTSMVAFLRRLRGSVRSSAFEHGLDAELRHHLELQTEAHIRRGMDPAAARAAAEKEFGSVAQVKDECRDSWGMRALDALGQDLRFGIRTLARYPSYTLVVLLTLALGIGANTAIFSVVHAVLLRSLPYANGDRLVEVRQQAPRAGIADMNLSAKEIADYRAQTPALDAVVEYHQMGFNLLGRGAASRVSTGVVSANFFSVLGIEPVLGRTFRAEDDTKDAPAVLLISHPYWQNTLGGDPNVVGRTFEMNDKVHTVVGVLPPVPLYPDDNDVYMPVSACPFRSSRDHIEDRQMRMMSAVGRLKPGVSLDRARGDLALVARRLQAGYPGDYPADAGFTTTALSLRDELTHRARPTLLTLLVITGFVLLLVCTNVANLTLAHLVGRDRELSVRAVLGAGRGRLARQLLTESTLLALGGGILGLAFAYAVRGLLVSFTSKFTPRATEIGIDPIVLLFTLGLSLLTGLFFGLVPAFGRRRDLGESLKEGQRTVTGHGGRARRALVIAQVAISFILLIGAGLTVRSFIKLQQVDAGFVADHVLTMRVYLDWVKYDTSAKRQGFYQPLLEKVASEPGVRSAAASLTFPLNESTPFNASIVIEGQVPAEGQPRPQVDFRLASPAYFRTIGMSLLQGRAFADADKADAPQVAIVNLSMARHRFGSADAVGHRVSFNGRDWITIVGVVNDVKQYGLDTKPSDELYRPFAQGGPLGATLLVRTIGDPMSVARSIQNDIRIIDPKQPLTRIETLEEVRSKSLASPRVTMILVTLFAVIALIMTAAGIVGVVSFSVKQRTTEIGVRVALGAPRSAVVAMIVQQGLAPVFAGLALGLVGAFALTRLAARLLFEVQPTDPPTYAIVLVGLSLVAALACLAPARRAAGIEPIEALHAN
jgi:putative ABC transport system permease protein